jgi:hypothetical protein
MRCLSRMSGNLQVRFLGGGAVATSPCYPNISADTTRPIFQVPAPTKLSHASILLIPVSA